MDLGGRCGRDAGMYVNRGRDADCAWTDFLLFIISDLFRDCEKSGTKPLELEYLEICVLSVSVGDQLSGHHDRYLSMESDVSRCRAVLCDYGWNIITVDHTDMCRLSDLFKERMLE